MKAGVAVKRFVVGSPKMGALSIPMFLGISLLTRLTHVVFEESAERTVVAQIAHAAFGGSQLFYVVQAMTAAILILAPNTAFQGFPRLASVLAEDGFMPHQFNNLGDRLPFSNGIVILALFASLLIFIFDARLTSLIQLYLVGCSCRSLLRSGGWCCIGERTKTAIGVAISGCKEQAEPPPHWSLASLLRPSFSRVPGWSYS